MELPLFEQVADAVRSLTPSELGQVNYRAHRRGIKVWLTPEEDRGERAPREHYEAQLVARRHIDGRDGAALEIGFHAEHPDTTRNVAAVETIANSEKALRKILGQEAEIAPFFGNDDWRRVSEAWLDPDLDDPELPVELASRLVDYLEAIEPLRDRADP